MRAVRTVTAYRDRYGIDTHTGLGPSPITEAQRLDQTRAKAAIWRGESIPREGSEVGTQRVTVSAETPTIR